MTYFHFECQETMSYLPNKPLLTNVIIFSLTVCGNLSNEVKDKLN
jgi:hypothetical protein